jgi:hypothetical protein
MRFSEREPDYLIKNGFLEKVNDLEHGGRRVLASRLGYRITPLFVDRFLGRIFDVPGAVFPEEMLRPELQDLGLFAEGIDAVVESHRRVALHYFEDGSIDAACPPLRALLHIMVDGTYQGMGVNDAAFRSLFSREALLTSDWYRERLLTKQLRDVQLWRRHLGSLEQFERDGGIGIDVAQRLNYTRSQLARVSDASYIQEITGTIGADPFTKQ